MIRTVILALCLSTTVASAQENPFIAAITNAGKAFEWILAETLWAELGPLGVDVRARSDGGPS